MNIKLQIAKYVFCDVLAAAVTWALFFAFRKIYVETAPLTVDEKFYTGIAVIPVFWLVCYALTGTYRNIYRRSRLKETGQTFVVTFFGVLTLFFVLLLDDEVVSYHQYYRSFFALFALQFILTETPRLILTSVTNYRIHNRLLGFNTLLVGSNGKALKVFREIESTRPASGNSLVGYVNVNGNNGNALNSCLPHLGSSKDLKEVIHRHRIEEVIFAMESSEHEYIQEMSTALEDTGVRIKVIPDMYDILTGSVKMTAIYGTPLIEISHEIMPPWEQELKRLIDLTVSLAVLILGSPLFLLLSIIVKLSSSGPVFYAHQRIGKSGKPFTMYKFRSMFCDAEKNGPALSSRNDPRVTPFGRFLRRFRLDEIPQFYNVFLGEMSIIGPRPERRYYVDQIVSRAPHYVRLHKITPGITSWGMVKFGYAENIDQMIERMKYDLLYLENMSLAVDLKIIIYTVLIVLKGRGR